MRKTKAMKLFVIFTERRDNNPYRHFASSAITSKTVTTNDFYFFFRLSTWIRERSCVLLLSGFLAKKYQSA